MSMDTVKSRLFASQGWKSLTAYEMTKRLCAELTNTGEKIPSWTAIRDVIGKGSANDINRAKDDFRKDHAETLRRMSGFVEGVPVQLNPIILALWSEAVAAVKSEFAQQELEWQADIAQANNDAEQARRGLEAAENEASRLSAALEGLQQANAALQQQVATEIAAKQQAERLFESSRAELASQRDELRTALQQAQAQTADAITRLEGVENHALRQVQEARDEASKKVAIIESKIKAQASDHAVEIARVNRQLRETQQGLIEANGSLALLTQDNEHLRERATRAETAADRLTSAKSLRSKIRDKPASRNTPKRH